MKEVGSYCKFQTPCGLCEIKSQFGLEVKCEFCKGEDQEHYKKEKPQIDAPVGSVKSVRIIDDSGKFRNIPLDRVIIERHGDPE